MSVEEAKECLGKIVGILMQGKYLARLIVAELTN